MALRNGYIHLYMANYLRWGTYRGYKKGYKDKDADAGIQHLDAGNEPDNNSAIVEKHKLLIKNLLANQYNSKVDIKVQNEVEKRLNYFFGGSALVKNREDKELYDYERELNKEIDERLKQFGYTFDRETGKVRGNGNGAYSPSEELKRAMRNELKRMNNKAFIKADTIERDIQNIDNIVKEYKDFIESKNNIGLTEHEVDNKNIDECFERIEQAKNTLIQAVNDVKTLSKTDARAKNYYEEIKKLYGMINVVNNDNAKTIQGNVLEAVLSFLNEDVEKVADFVVADNLKEDKLSTAGQGSEDRINRKEVVREFLNLDINNELFTFNTNYKGRKKTDCEITLTFKQPKQKKPKRQKMSLSLKSYDLSSSRNLHLLSEKANFLNTFLQSMMDKEEYLYHYFNMTVPHEDDGVVSLPDSYMRAKENVSYALHLFMAYRAMAGQFSKTEAKYFLVNDVSKKGGEKEKYFLINIKSMFAKIVEEKITVKGEKDSLEQIFSYELPKNNKYDLTFSKNDNKKVRKIKNRPVSEAADIRMAKIFNEIANAHAGVAIKANALKNIK